MELCLRVANARDGDVQTLEKIDPNNTYQYKYISTVCKICLVLFHKVCEVFDKLTASNGFCLGGLKYNPGKPRTMRYTATLIQAITFITAADRSCVRDQLEENCIKYHTNKAHVVNLNNFKGLQTDLFCLTSVMNRMLRF